MLVETPHLLIHLIGMDIYLIFDTAYTVGAVQNATFVYYYLHLSKTGVRDPFPAQIQ